MDIYGVVLFCFLQQEEAIREEKSAMEKIAAILASLTARKTAIVSSFFIRFVNILVDDSL